MSKSIFKNFDLEDLDNIYYDKDKKQPVGLLGMNIFLASLHCAVEKDYIIHNGEKIKVDSHLDPLTNDEFFLIDEKVKILGQCGRDLESGTQILLEEDQPLNNTAEFRFSTCLEAITGNAFLKDESGIVDRQIYGWGALQIFEHALNGIAKYGLTHRFVDDVLIGVHYISLANKELDPSDQEAIDLLVEQRSAAKNSEKATKGYAEGQFGIANTVIFNEWKKQNDAIAAEKNTDGAAKQFNASEFARKMQIKHPLITDITTIKRWCTEWKRQKVNSSPAD